jgi:HrpA-like RNA helicase
MQLMAAHPLLRDPKKVQAFPLHSSLPPDAQRSVFKKMPPGVRKVRYPLSLV